MTKMEENKENFKDKFNLNTFRTSNILSVYHLLNSDK